METSNSGLDFHEKSAHLFGWINLYFVCEWPNVAVARILAFQELEKEFFSYHITNKYDTRNLCYQLRVYFNDTNVAHVLIQQENVIITMMLI